MITLLTAAAALALGAAPAQALPSTLPRIDASRLKVRAELSRAMQRAHARVVHAEPTLDVEVVGAAPAEGGAVVVASMPPEAPGPTVAATGAPTPPATEAGGDASDGCTGTGEACDEQEHARPSPAAAAGVRAQPEARADGERPCAGTGEACDEEEGLRATPISPAPSPTLTQAAAGAGADAETYAMRFDVPAGGSLEVLIDREGRVRDVRVLGGAGARTAGR